MRGVIASESSNNAKEGGALVPTIAFGVPGSATMAILLGAFLIHGLVPGPDMLHKNLDITYSMVWSVALANILGAGMCYAFSPQFARLATLRFTLILPAVMGIIYIGAFEATRSGATSTRCCSSAWSAGDEAVQVAAAAAHSRRGARRHHRALHVHLGRALRHQLVCASGGRDPVHHGDHRPAAAVDADIRSQGGVVKMATSFQAPTFHPSQLFTMFFIALIGSHGGRWRCAGTSAPRSCRWSSAASRSRSRAEPVQRHVPQADRARSRKAWRAGAASRSSRRSTWI